MVKHTGMNKVLMEQGLGVVNKHWHWGGSKAGVCRGWLSPVLFLLPPFSNEDLPALLLAQHRDVLHPQVLAQVPVLSVPWATTLPCGQCC